MTSRDRAGRRLVVIGALTGLLCGCGTQGTTVGPSKPSVAASAASAAPVAPSSWSGSLDQPAALPAGSCEAGYVESHRDFFTQSANASLQINANGNTTMTLQTSGGQKCVFSGDTTGGTLTLSARHETCAGYPLSQPVINGLMETCRSIDAMEGPYWGNGKLLARMTTSEIDGSWTFLVQDLTTFTVELHVHLAQ